MFGIAATALDEFAQGTISRRTLIETLTLAATAFAAASRADAAQAQVGVTPAAVNHVSYTCADFRKAADWYSKVFNLEQVGLKKDEVTLPFGAKGGHPYGVTAADVPPTFLLCRTRDANAPLANGQPRPKATCVVNHMAFTVANFESARVAETLKAMGVENVRATGANAIHMADPFGYDVEVCGFANNALTDGA